MVIYILYMIYDYDVYLYVGILVLQKVVNLLRWAQLIMSNVLGSTMD